MTNPPPLPPGPGWYEDPGAPGRLRWWDGRQWGPLTPPNPTYKPEPVGFAAASLVVGLLAAMFFWVPLVGIVLGLPAVAFGVVALQRGQSRAMAITGTVTGAVGIVANILLFIVVAAATR